MQLIKVISAEHNITSLLLLLIPELICSILEKIIGIDEATETTSIPELEIITVDLIQNVNLEGFVTEEVVR